MIRSGGIGITKGESAMGYGYISGAEYLNENTDYEKLTYMKPKASDNVKINEYTKKSLGGIVYCTNDSNENGYIDLPLLLYKGYRAINMDSKEEISVQNGENGLIRIIIPAGLDAHIKVSFVSPVYWRVAEIISIIAYILLIAACIMPKRRENA